MSQRAPVDERAIERTLAPFGHNCTLPGEAYTAIDVLAWEREHLYDMGWVCLGRSSDLSEPGDQTARRAGLESVVLVRGTDGVLRGFSNVCRHRGSELIEEDETRCGKVIACPYHGWVYDHDGSLRGAPGFRDDPGFDPSELGLAPVRVQEWHGWVFANVSGDAAPLAQYLGRVGEMLEPYQPERLRTAVTIRYEVGSNWKLIGENYHECYHCSNIHPELCRVTPPESGVNFEPDGAWVGGTMVLMDHAVTMSLSGESHGVFLPGLSQEQRRQIVYVQLFPNIFVGCHPDYILTHRETPLAPDRTLIECEWLFPPEALEQEGFDPTYAVEFWDITNKEDWRACERVQRGVSTRAYRPGPLSRREDAVYDVVTLVAKAYRDGRATRPAPRKRDALADVRAR